MKNKAEQYNELIQMQLNSFQTEMTNTRKSEKKMSILRHDTRHHLSVLRTLIQQGETDKALEYLNEVSQTYDDTVIKTYCRNETWFTLHDQTDKKITSSYVKHKILPPLHSTHYQQLAV